MTLRAITHILFKSETVEYKIIPSVSQVTKNKDGGFVPSSVSFSVYKIIGGSQVQLVSLSSGVKMRIRNLSTGAWSNDFNFVSVSVFANSNTDRIEAEIYNSTLSTWLPADMLASVTVPVISDGTDAFQIVTSQDSIPVRCSSNGAPTSLPVAIQVRLYRGGEIYNLLNWYSCSVSADSSSTVNSTYSSDSKLESDYFTINLTGVNSNTGQITISIVPYSGAATITKTIRILKVIDGPVGATGAIYLPRGEWNNSDTYTKTSAAIMYVVYQGYCYEPNVASVTGGNTPLYDVQNSLGNWKSMGRYDLVATQVLLANFALIAGGVFWNNKLMSQFGKDDTGADSTTYTNYSEDGAGNANGTFFPNILIDFLNGKLKSVDAIIEGILRTASSGARIEIGKERNAMQMYNANGDMKVKLSPTDVMTLAQILSGITNNTTLTAATKSIQNSTYGTVIEALNSNETIILAGPQVYNVTIPPISWSVLANAGVVNNNQGSAAGVTWSLVNVLTGQTVAGQTIGNVVSHSTSNVTSSGSSSPFVIYGVPAGTYQIKIQLDAVNTNQGNPGNAQAMASISSGAIVSAVSLNNILELGLNGLNLINSLTNFVHLSTDCFKLKFGDFEQQIDSSGIKMYGLRRSIRTVTSDTLIVGTDCYILCKNTTAITIFLGDSADGCTAGQEIYIGKLGSANITIGYYFYRQGSLKETVGISDTGKFSKFVFDGTYWYFSHYNQ